MNQSESHSIKSPKQSLKMLDNEKLSEKLSSLVGKGRSQSLIKGIIQSPYNNQLQTTKEPRRSSDIMNIQIKENNFSPPKLKEMPLTPP